MGGEEEDGLNEALSGWVGYLHGVEGLGEEGEAGEEVGEGPHQALEEGGGGLVGGFLGQDVFDLGGGFQALFGGWVGGSVSPSIDCRGGWVGG